MPYADIVYARPGDFVPFAIQADSNGDPATRGDGVEVTGENRSNPIATLVESSDGVGIGILTEDPEDYDSSTTYSAGDSLGVATVALSTTVLRVTPDSGYTPSIGDYVKFTDGGDVTGVTGPTATGLGGAVTQNLGVDGNGNLETDNGSDIELDITDGFPFGFVIATVANEFNVGDRIAVATMR